MWLGALRLAGGLWQVRGSEIVCATDSQAYKAKVTLKPAAQPDQMAAGSLINKGVYRWHLAYAPEKNLLSIQK